MYIRNLDLPMILSLAGFSELIWYVWHLIGTRPTQFFWWAGLISANLMILWMITFMVLHRRHARLYSDSC